MTAYLYTESGKATVLPPLLEWEYTLTDGRACNSARVVFHPQAAQRKQLCRGAFLRLEEGGVTRFYGVVDEVEMTLDDRGTRAEILCRGFMALLMGRELRQQEWVFFHRSDAEKIAREAGITKIRGSAMGSVKGMSWATGTTAWAIIRGYCRHWDGSCPRFLADGTLVLGKTEPARRSLGAGSPVTECRFRFSPCDGLGRVEVLRPGGEVETAEAGKLQDLGVRANRVAVQTNYFLKATQKTARQLLEDQNRSLVTVELTLAGDRAMEPGDRVDLNLPGLALTGVFTVATVCRRLDDRGTAMVLELEGDESHVAG